MTPIADRKLIVCEITEVEPTSEITLDEACNALSRAIQKATSQYVEKLEQIGSIQGSRNAIIKISEAAINELDSCWKESSG